MNAVLDKPVRTGAKRRIQAVAIIDGEPERSAFGHAAGRHLVVDHNNLAWPESDSGDILDIDFDVREYRGEGQYLVQHVPPSGDIVGVLNRAPYTSGWTAVVHLMRGSNGLEIFHSGMEGRCWREIPPDELARYRFLGRVHGIYRRSDIGRIPHLNFVGKVAGVGEAPDGTACIQFKPGEGRVITVSGLTDDEARRVAKLMLSPARLEIKP